MVKSVNGVTRRFAEGGTKTNRYRIVEKVT